MAPKHDATVTPRPLVIIEVKEKDLTLEDAASKLKKFLNKEAGAQSAATGTSQQLHELYAHLAQQVSRRDDSMHASE
ncbi:hypothetical protein GGI07_001511 [Coemansia sp. Benny D115]|nr:hypothetical protein GGI07_001511 [Coemansia sp. Benny D115]